MSESDPPKIQFPAPDYPISVVADTRDGFVSELEAIVRSHCDDYDPETLKVTASKSGRYQSFRFAITAQSEAQLKALHEALKATGSVHMVL